MRAPRVATTTTFTVVSADDEGDGVIVADVLRRAVAAVSASKRGDHSAPLKDKESSSSDEDTDSYFEGDMVVETDDLVASDQEMASEKSGHRRRGSLRG